MSGNGLAKGLGFLLCVSATAAMADVAVTNGKTIYFHQAKHVCVKGKPCVKHPSNIKVRKIQSSGYHMALLDYYTQKIAQDGYYDPYANAKYTYLANNWLPGVTYKNSLQPTAQPNVYDLLNQTAISHFGGYANINNQNSSEYGYVSGGGGLYYNDIFGGDKLSVNGSSSVNTNSTYASINYQKELGTYGTQLVATFTYTGTGPQNTGVYNYDGYGLTYNVAAVQPFYISAATNLALTGGYSLVESNTNAFLEYNPAQSYAAGPPNPIVYSSQEINQQLPTIYAQFDFSHDYSIGNFWGFVRAASVSYYGIPTIYNSVGGVQDTSNPTPAASPSLNTFLVNGSYNQVVTLPKNVSFYFGTNAQVTPTDALPSAQQFVYSDGPFVDQAYVGDYGISGRVEPRYDLPINTVWLKKLQWYAYYGGAYLVNTTTIFVPYKSAQATDTGFGVRGYFGHNISGYVEADKPLSETAVAGVYNGWQGFFSLGVQF